MMKQKFDMIFRRERGPNLGKLGGIVTESPSPDWTLCQGMMTMYIGEVISGQNIANWKPNVSHSCCITRSGTVINKHKQLIISNYMLDFIDNDFNSPARGEVGFMSRTREIVVHCDCESRKEEFIGSIAPQRINWLNDTELSILRLLEGVKRFHIAQQSPNICM